MLEEKIVVASKLEGIDLIRNHTRKIFQHSSLNMNHFNRIFLGISEAVNNAILHGNKLNPEKEVCVHMHVEGNKITVEILDEGNGFSSLDVQDPTTVDNIKREKGRGLYILRSIADEVSFLEEGRRVIIKFTIPE